MGRNSSEPSSTNTDNCDGVLQLLSQASMLETTVGKLIDTNKMVDSTTQSRIWHTYEVSHTV